VPRRIEQIQLIGLTRLAFVTHRYRMRFDCDPPLPFKVHRIKKLVLPLTILDRASALQQPVGQGRFAVIDVRNDAKIPRQLNGHESAIMRACRYAVNYPALSFRAKSRNLRFNSKSICHGHFQNFQIGHLTLMRSPGVFTGRLDVTAVIEPSKYPASIRRRLFKSADKQQFN
jgi:hypothetical protein